MTTRSFKLGDKVRPHPLHLSRGVRGVITKIEPMEPLGQKITVVSSYDGQLVSDLAGYFERDE